MDHPSGDCDEKPEEEDKEYEDAHVLAHARWSFSVKYGVVLG